MITSVRLVNFKNFADETLRLGPFTVIVGTNASGKSNIRDAFRFLHGIGRGYTLAEIMGGKYGGGGQMEWAGIRGAMNEIIRMGQRGFAVGVEANLCATSLHYVVEADYDVFSDRTYRVKNEELKQGTSPVYIGNREGQRLILDFGDLEGYMYPMDSDGPFLSEVAELYWPPGELTPIEDAMVDMKKVLGNVRFLDFVPDRMREPGFPGSKLGDSGQNLAAALEEIHIDPERKNILTSWAQELTPMDVSGFEFLRDPSGRIHLQIRETNGRRVSAYSASDGTLRFLAMLAALLSPDASGLYFFEEIENGIHPSRLWLLLELIEKQTEKGNVQVVATTHSPDLLTLVNDTTFENTSVIGRIESVGDAVIRPVAELHNAQKLRKSQGLGRLHTSGWMEDILSFAEADRDDQKAEE